MVCSLNTEGRGEGGVMVQIMEKVNHCRRKERQVISYEVLRRLAEWFVYLNSPD